MNDETYRAVKHKLAEIGLDIEQYIIRTEHVAKGSFCAQNSFAFPLKVVSKMYVQSQRTLLAVDDASSIVSALQLPLLSGKCHIINAFSTPIPFLILSKN